MTGRPTTSQPAQPSGTFRATLAQANGGIVQNSGDEDGVTNAEWQLADLVDAVAAEIDHAEDTLSLKSFARGMAFAIKQLSLDLEVTVRRADDGRILFRTVDPGETSPTLLKLAFPQVIQSQLEAVRQPPRRP